MNSDLQFIDKDDNVAVDESLFQDLEELDVDDEDYKPDFNDDDDDDDDDYDEDD